MVNWCQLAPRKEVSMKDYRTIAIAKSKHNVVQFAIVEELTGSAVAIVKSKMGVFDIHFLENAPTTMKLVMAYLDQEKSYFENF